MRKLLMMTALGLGVTACTTMNKADDMRLSELCEARSFAVFFETGSSDLDNDAEATLSAVSSAYDDCDLFRLEVVGYADSVGESEANLALSDRRADAVLAELNDRGVMADRVAIVPMGERTILDDEEPDAFERRVVVTLIPE